MFCEWLNNYHSMFSEWLNNCHSMFSEWLANCRSMLTERVGEAIEWAFFHPDKIFAGLCVVCIILWAISMAFSTSSSQRSSQNTSNMKVEENTDLEELGIIIGLSMIDKAYREEMKKLEEEQKKRK